jgi:ABC-type transport system involved in multi-copper enzyme maturation permease subunit
MKVFATPESRWKVLFLTVAVIVGFAGLYLATRRYAPFIFDAAELRVWIAGFGVWAPIVFILLQALQVLLAPIPGQLAAVVAGYLAVTGERTSGSLRVLLSYPFSRRDIVVGNLVGRAVITVAALLVGFAVASVLVVVLYGIPSVGIFAGFVGTGVLLGMVFTGLAVGGSAVADKLHPAKAAGGESDADCSDR